MPHRCSSTFKHRCTYKENSMFRTVAASYVFSNSCYSSRQESKSRFFFSGKVLRIVRLLCGLALNLCLLSVNAIAQSNQSSPVGTNLSIVTYYTPEQPFLNIFKLGGG